MSNFLKEYNRLSQPKKTTNKKQSNQSYVNQFGTAFYPHFL